MFPGHLKIFYVWLSAENLLKIPVALLGGGSESLFGKLYQADTGLARHSQSWLGSKPKLPYTVQ